MVDKKILALILLTLGFAVFDEITTAISLARGNIETNPHHLIGKITFFTPLFLLLKMNKGKKFIILACVIMSFAFLYAGLVNLSYAKTTYETPPNIYIYLILLAIAILTIIIVLILLYKFYF